MHVDIRGHKCDETGHRRWFSHLPSSSCFTAEVVSVAIGSALYPTVCVRCCQERVPIWAPKALQNPFPEIRDLSKAICGAGGPTSTYASFVPKETPWDTSRKEEEFAFKCER